MVLAHFHSLVLLELVPMVSLSHMLALLVSMARLIWSFTGELAHFRSLVLLEPVPMVFCLMLALLVDGSGLIWSFYCADTAFIAVTELVPRFSTIRRCTGAVAPPVELVFLCNFRTLTARIPPLQMFGLFTCINHNWIRRNY